MSTPLAESANVDDDEFVELTVGSTVTGNTRAGSDSHTLSTDKASAGSPPTVVTWYATACETAGLPGFASDIDPGGTTACTAPEPSTKDTEPSDSRRAVRPCRCNGNTQDVATFAECRTSDSFTPVAVVVNDTSVPDNTPGYVTVGPDTVGVTFAAPCSPYAIACEPSNRTEVSAASSADPA